MTKEISILEPERFNKYPPRNEENITTEIVIDSSTEDFELARKSIKDALNTGSDALKELYEITKQGQRSDGFEGISKMIKEISDASNKLMDIHEKIDRIRSKKNIKPELGESSHLTTVELSRMINQLSFPEPKEMKSI